MLNVLKKDGPNVSCASMVLKKTIGYIGNTDALYIIFSASSCSLSVLSEINGVGYKASVDKEVLILTLGYSHEIFYAMPKGITAVFEVEQRNVGTVNNCKY
jgi:hypothetical protein